MYEFSLNNRNSDFVNKIAEVKRSIFIWNKNFITIDSFFFRYLV